MENKRKYTREEKIAYFTAMKNRAEKALQRLESPDYQDWDSDVAKQLRERKKFEEMASIVRAVLDAREEVKGS